MCFLFTFKCAMFLLVSVFFAFVCTLIFIQDLFALIPLFKVTVLSK